MPRKSARMSRMNFSSSTMRTRGRSSCGVVMGDGTGTPSPPTLPDFSRSLGSCAPVAPLSRPWKGAAVRGRVDSAHFTRRLEQRDGSRSGTWIALAYCALGALGATLAEAFGQSPLTTKPWLGEAGPIAAVGSLALGALVAAVTVHTTRVLG